MQYYSESMIYRDLHTWYKTEVTKEKDVKYLKPVFQSVN